MKNTTVLLTLVLLTLSNFSLTAETNSNKKAQAYYFAAEEAYGNKQYDDALTCLDKAEDLLGKSNAVLEGLKVKTLYDKGDYVDAKQALNNFYTFKSSKKLEKEIASYLLKLESKANEIFEQVTIEMSLKLKDAVVNKNYSGALTILEKTENLLGKKIASFHVFKSQVLLDKGDYTGARQELKKYHSFKDSRKLEKEIELEQALEPAVFLIEQKLDELGKQN